MNERNKQERRGGAAMPTAEELEKKKKREAELMWKKILAYYMMETYVMKAQAQAEAELRNAYLATSRYVKECALSRLLEKKGDGPSPAELLAELAALEPPDSPLGELWAEMRRKPPSEKKLTNALTRVIEKEPPRMLEDARKERERRSEWERSHEKEIEAAGDFELVDEEKLRYEQRLAKKMAFFRVVLPPEVYRELAHHLETGAYTLSAAQLDALEEPPERKRDYKAYMEEKRVEPQEKAGRLANAGDVYSAAAYMLAAWEQRDAPAFDEQKADRRAMELSGKRAFKAYMKGHPGSLLAAARGTAVEAVYDGVAALDSDLSRRDAILADARDSLKKMTAGKTACFHRMLNALDRFVNADTEPSKRERSELTVALAEYITTDCAPGSREINTDCFRQAMRSVKALVPEKDFSAFVNRINIGREPKVRAADFDLAPAVREKAQAEPARQLIREAAPR